MTTPKEALEAARKCIWSGGDSLATVAIIDEALASLEGDAVERVELPLARAINDVLNAMVDAQEEMTTTKMSARILGDDTVRAIIATGLVPDEAASPCTILSSDCVDPDIEQAIRADEREKCAKIAQSGSRLTEWVIHPDVKRTAPTRLVQLVIAAAIRSNRREA